MEIEGKVAVVTGGGTGIGRATALALAKAGADVVVAARNEGEIEKVRGEIEALGRRALAVRTDVTKSADVQALFDRTIQEMGCADILMNNAGVHMLGNVEDVSLEDWKWIVDTNFWGVVYGVKAFLPHMLQRGSGHIVNTASIAGLIGGLDESIPYSTTKFAVVGLSEGLAAYLHPKGIGVTVLCPGLVLTELMDGQHIARPDDPVLRQGWDRVSDALVKGDWSYMGPEVLEPPEVADRVVEAIRNNQYLILTHSYSKDLLISRAQDPQGVIAALGQRLQEREAGFKAMAAKLNSAP